ncbi:putative reverse transcriptase domain-containing protein [Tanacetum coccineum]
MEQEIWTLTLKGDDIEAYNNRFHELVLRCAELVSTEKKKIEKYIRGFPEGIKGNVTSSKPATLHDAINMARELIEQGVQAKALRIGDSNKRKWEDQQGNNYHQQQNRRQEAAKLYKREFVIVCHEKVVRIPLEGNEMLWVHSERTQGVVKTLMEHKKVEFRIDLVHGATSVAKSPYRLAPLEMQELSEQLRELQDKVLELLRKEKLYAKFTKSEAVKNWEVPTTPSEI